MKRATWCYISEDRIGHTERWEISNSIADDRVYGNVGEKDRKIKPNIQIFINV
jgi:hypothetical protein